MTEYIENRTFDEIKIGDRASLTHTLTKADIELFAVMSGDVNPAHLDEEYARSDIFHKIIAHGMWGGALISTVLGTMLPGPGTIYLSQTLRFRRPVTIGDTITVAVTVTAKDPEKRRVTLDCQCINQHDEVVISGSAEVLAPTEKVKRQRVSLPEVLLHKPGANYEAIIKRASSLGPVRAAVVFPSEPIAFHGIVEATQANLIDPIIVGPEMPLRRVAETLDINLDAFHLEPTSDGRTAAARAVAMARTGKVEAIVDPGVRYYGLLHELVAHETGIVDHRRLSHVYAMDVPNYPRLLFITDAGMNTDPTLEEKRAIVQNAIDLALALGVEQPKVAILAAVETINPRLRSTLDAAALCKMVDRRQIVGGLVDGPLTFENAVSPEAVRQAKLTSPVAGQADILVAPDLEAGTMLVQQLDRLANAQSAGIVVGGRVPVALPEPSGNPQSVLAACAMAVLVARSAGKHD